MNTKLLFVLLLVCAAGVTRCQNVGVGNANPSSKLDISGDIALREGAAIAVAAGNNAIVLPAAKNSVYRLTGAAGAFAITGISAGNDGSVLNLINNTGQVMTLNNSASVQTNTGANIVSSGAAAAVSLVYNATMGKWVVLSSEDFGVISVGLALPGIFTVSNSPVTTNGTLTGTFNNQNANSFFAGPAANPAAVPTFRPLVQADIPVLGQSAITTTSTAAGVISAFAQVPGMTSTFALAQPSYVEVQTQGFLELTSGVVGHYNVANMWIVVDGVNYWMEACSLDTYTSSVFSYIGNWAGGQDFALAAGVHTISIWTNPEFAGGTSSTYTAGGAVGNISQSYMNISVLHQ